MKPTYRVIADRKDITALINDRLLLLRISDKPGMESDEFELRIDDRDQAVALPARGGVVEVLLGYEASRSNAWAPTPSTKCKSPDRPMS